VRRVYSDLSDNLAMNITPVGTTQAAAQLPAQVL